VVVITVVVLTISDLRSDVPGVELVMMHHAFEVGGVVRIALSDILAAFRVRAKRPLELDALRRNVVQVM
jgi:hypothetical protein